MRRGDDAVRCYVTDSEYWPSQLLTKSKIDASCSQLFGCSYDSCRRASIAMPRYVGSAGHHGCICISKIATLSCSIESNRRCTRFRGCRVSFSSSLEFETTLLGCELITPQSLHLALHGTSITWGLLRTALHWSGIYQTLCGPLAMHQDRPGSSSWMVLSFIHPGGSLMVSMSERSESGEYCIHSHILSICIAQVSPHNPALNALHLHLQPDRETEISQWLVIQNMHPDKCAAFLTGPEV